MYEFPLGERRYQVGKLNAMDQLHLARRLGPMLVVAGISVDMLRQGLKPDLGDMVAMAGPVMELLSRMPDDEVEYIVFKTLAVVNLQQGTGWAPFLGPDGKSFMFQNIEMPEMFRVVLEVIRVNLGPFLTGLGEELTSPGS